MTILTGKRAVLAMVLAACLGASDASAQVFGTFSWRMEPYCNIITLTITQIPGGYTLDGHDNLCGTGGRLAAATGQALLNADGTVGLNFTIVLPPIGRDVHVAALISPANGSGTWADGVGNIGTFLLGAPGAGSPRPLPLATAASGQVLTGELSARYVANSGAFDVVSGSYRPPLPPGTPTPILEFVPSAPTATCPGIGQALAGRLCVYSYNSQNISSLVLVPGAGFSRLHGFTLQINASNAATGGYLIASWAYRVP